MFLYQLPARPVDDVVKQLTLAADHVRWSIARCNEGSASFNDVVEAVAHYNACVAQGRDLIVNFSNLIADAMDGHTHRWERTQGVHYQAWRDAVDSVTLDVIRVNLRRPIEVPAMTAADRLKKDLKMRPDP